MNEAGVWNEIMPVELSYVTSSMTVEVAELVVHSSFALRGLIAMSAAETVLLMAVPLPSVQL